MSKIAEIKERLCEVTSVFPTPWKWNQPKGFGARIFLWDSKSDPWNPITEIDQSFPLADYIANSPSDIKYLLSEIERLQKENENLKRESDRWQNSYYVAQSCFDELELQYLKPKSEWLKDCGGTSLRCGVCDKCREMKEVNE